MRNLSIEELDFVSGGNDCCGGGGGISVGGISVGGIGNGSLNGNASGNNVDVSADGNNVANGNHVASGNNTDLDSTVSTGVGATVKNLLNGCLSIL